MENNQNINYIELIVTLSGRGIVNFDGEPNNTFLTSQGLSHLTVVNNKKYTNNTKISKMVIDEYDQTEKKSKYNVAISSTTIKHYMFGTHDTLKNIENDSLDKVTIKSATFTNVIKGYLKTGLANNLTITKEAALTVCDAVQVSKNVAKLDTFSNSGVKNSNSLFHKMNVGDTEYEFKVVFQSKMLEMVIADAMMGKIAFHPDYSDLFLSTLKKQNRDFEGEMGYFKLKESTSEYPEVFYGMQASNKDKNFYLQTILAKLVNIKMAKSGANVEVTNIRYRINNGMQSVLEMNQSEDKGYKPFDYETFKNTTFNFRTFYEQVDDNLAKETQEFLASLDKLSGEEQAEKIEKSKTK